MRTGQVASAALAVGIVGALLLAATPSASACALTNPVSCSVQVVNSARSVAMGKVSQIQQDTAGHRDGAMAAAGGAAGQAQDAFDGALEDATDASAQAQADAANARQDAEDRAAAAPGQAADALDAAGNDAENRSNSVQDWKSQTLDHQTNCMATPPPVPPPVSGGPDVQGAIDGNLAYVQAQLALAQYVIDNGPGNPAVTTGYALTEGFDNTVEVFKSWDANLFGPITAMVQASTDDLPPDPPSVTLPQGDVTVFVFAAVGDASTQAQCHADAHLPSL